LPFGQIFDTPKGVSSDVTLCFSTVEANSICFAVISEGDDYIVLGCFCLAVDTVLAHQNEDGTTPLKPISFLLLEPP